MKDKKINIIFLILAITIPLFFTITVALIKERKEPLNITKNTYVHVFYVNTTGKDKEVLNLVDGYNLDCEVILHDITKESNLYKDVLDYFKITPDIYNPLIVINDEYLTEFDNDLLKEKISFAIKKYQKENLTENDIKTYNIVDRLQTKEML